MAAPGDLCRWAGKRHACLPAVAQVYGNEAEVGEAVRTCGVPREQVFVTSKVGVQGRGAGISRSPVLQPPYATLRQSVPC